MRKSNEKMRKKMKQNSFISTLCVTINDKTIVIYRLFVI